MLYSIIMNDIKIHTIFKASYHILVIMKYMIRIYLHNLYNFVNDNIVERTNVSKIYSSGSEVSFRPYFMVCLRHLKVFSISEFNAVYGFFPAGLVFNCCLCWRIVMLQYAVVK